MGHYIVDETWGNIYYPWQDAVDILNEQAVLLSLVSSQIYWNERLYGDVEEYSGIPMISHEVLATGYITFPHSSGWVSRYYQIIDGWYNDDYRYVNHSLGVELLIMEWVEMGISPTTPHPTPAPN